jgi:hypothetical protein
MLGRAAESFTDGSGLKVLYLIMSWYEYVDQEKQFCMLNPKYKQVFGVIIMIIAHNLIP